MLKINPFINNYVKPKMHQILGVGAVASLALLQAGCNTHDFEDLGITPKKDTISVKVDTATHKYPFNIYI